MKRNEINILNYLASNAKSSGSLPQYLIHLEVIILFLRLLLTPSQFDFYSLKGKQATVEEKNPSLPRVYDEKNDNLEMLFAVKTEERKKRKRDEENVSVNCGRMYFV